MKYKEAKDIIMQLINMYSERGAIINSNDKNIADYTLKIPNYLNIALRTVSNRFPIESRMTINKTATSGLVEIDMPYNFIRISKVYKSIDGEIYEYDKYTYLSDSSIALPPSETGTFIIRYLRLSEEIKNNCSSDTVIDIQKALENAVLYYTAATLIQPERPDIASRLFEQYTELIATYKPQEVKQRRVRLI